MRTTPNNITELKPNEVFVFGSNLSGFHGGGAALTAMKWGAIYGKGVGIQGKTYAIPTKSKNISRTLEIHEIKPYVDSFIEWAKYHSGNIFLVTGIGCGLAGLTHEQVAPLFESAKHIHNIYLPDRFRQVLNN